jgi:hypothetical protein
VTSRLPSADALRDIVYTDERRAFMVACGDCSLKLMRVDETPYDIVFEDLLYLDTAENWAKRRELFAILLESDKGRAWLAARAEEYAAEQADEAASEVDE